MPPPTLERPRSVSWALVLLYATIGLGIVRCPLLFSSATADYPASYIIFIWTLSFAVYLLLVFLIGRGRGWARITYLVLFIMSIPYGVLPLFKSFSAHRASNFILVGQLTINVVAFVLLFQPANDAWFRRVSTPTTTDGGAR